MDKRFQFRTVADGGQIANSLQRPSDEPSRARGDLGRPMYRPPLTPCNSGRGRCAQSVRVPMPFHERGTHCPVSGPFARAPARGHPVDELTRARQMCRPADTNITRTRSGCTTRRAPCCDDAGALSGTSIAKDRIILFAEGGRQPRRAECPSALPPRLARRPFSAGGTQHGERALQCEKTDSSS
jgi:hypothetical protein